MKVLCLLILMLTGCSVGRDYVCPEVVTPAAWQSGAGIEKSRALWPDLDWWKAFSDPQLDELEETAVKGNYDLKAALSRIDQERALVKIAGADLYPFLDAGAEAVRSRSSGSSGNGGGSGGDSTSLGLQLTASYEVDLWGKFRQAREAVQSTFEASIYDQRAVALTLAGDVATSYFQFLALNDRLEIARETISLEKRTLDIIEKRYRGGLVSGLDLAQAKTALASVEASVFAIEQDRKQTLHALTILLGRSPGELKLVAKSLMKTAIPPAIPAGLPSGLLERRPDILRAEADLMAANADIRVAKANLFPSIQLTAAGGYASSSLSTLITPESAFYTLAAGMLAPIFQGGRLRGEYERTQARYAELVQNYHQAVILAFRDVEDALVAIEQLVPREAALTEAVAQAERSYSLALIRYQAGHVDYLPVLEADRALLNARNALVDARLARLSAIVALYRALAGGWPGTV